eukprot:5138560-Prymnesium_polylepis.1
MLKCESRGSAARRGRILLRYGPHPSRRLTHREASTSRCDCRFVATLRLQSVRAWSADEKLNTRLM